MIGVVRERAHVAGANVKHMVRVGGAVGDAMADVGSFFDQRHGERGLRVAEQMTGQQHTAGSSADYDDPPAGGARRDRARVKRGRRVCRQRDDDFAESNV